MKLKLLKKEKEATDTYSFYFSLDKKLSFEPGQYLYLTLDFPLDKDPRGNSRQFTIASSPTEGGVIQITTRVRPDSFYKQELNKIKEGDSLEAKGPNGSYIFNEKIVKSSQNNIFLAGGIGITPFRSFLKYAIDKKLNLPLYLLYSNSDNEFVFKKEIDKWSEDFNFIHIRYVNTSEKGRINKEIIKKYLKKNKLDIGSTTFWVVGPKSFVSAMEDILEDLGISFKNIKTEKFTGY